MRGRDGALIAVIGAIALPCAALIYHVASLPLQPIHAATARVVAIAPPVSKYSNRETVVVRNAHGTGQFTIALDDARCNVGDVVPVQQQGITLTRAATTCR